MFRLFRGFVAEGLGIGGLLWALSLLSGEAPEPVQRPSSASHEASSALSASEAVTLRKPAIFASLEPPVDAAIVEPESPTFFRGTDSLFDRR